MPGLRLAILIVETPPSVTISPDWSMPLPRIEMSCPSDWGFFDRMTTGPAVAVAVDFTYFKPLAATSISTTCPSAALDTADDTAEETADDTPAGADTGVVADEEVPDDPQPAASITIAKPVAAIALNLKVVGMYDLRLGGNRRLHGHDTLGRSDPLVAGVVVARHSAGTRRAAASTPRTRHRSLVMRSEWLASVRGGHPIRRSRLAVTNSTVAQRWRFFGQG